MKSRMTKPAEDVDRNGQAEDDGPLWTTAAKERPRKLSWLWPGRILEDGLTILEGQKGVGKSSLCAALVAAVTARGKLLHRKRTPPAGVIWLAGEEHYGRDVRPRLLASGADLSRVVFPGEDSRGRRRRVVLPHMLPQLERAISDNAVSLVIVDPLASFIDGETDLRADQSTHQVLDPLADLAHAQRCCILLSRHLSKNTSADRIDRGLGGAAVGGAARSVLVIDWPDRSSARRVLRVVACNAARPAPGMEYELADQDGYPVMRGARELLASEDDETADQLDPGERDARADAVLLLRRLLAEEWVASQTVLAEAERAGISPRTLRTAKGDLKVQSKRVGKAHPPYWEWGPPAGGWNGGG